MPNNYLQVWISAENRQQADLILNALLAKKLITGGLVINAPARFLWRKALTDMDYFFLFTFTTRNNKEGIISEVKKLSVEEVPMLSFIPFNGNEELTQWIESTLVPYI